MFFQLFMTLWVQLLYFCYVSTQRATYNLIQFFKHTIITEGNCECPNKFFFSYSTHAWRQSPWPHPMYKHTHRKFSQSSDSIMTVISVRVLDRSSSPGHGWSRSSECVHSTLSTETKINLKNLNLPSIMYKIHFAINTTLIHTPPCSHRMVYIITVH